MDIRFFLGKDYRKVDSFIKIPETNVGNLINVEESEEFHKKISEKQKKV